MFTGLIEATGVVADLKDTGAGLRLRVQTTWLDQAVHNYVLHSKQVRSALLVPERALATDQNIKFVYVVGDDGTATRRTITLGDQRSEMRIVTVSLGRDREPYRALVGPVDRLGQHQALAVAEPLEPVDDSVDRVMTLLLIAVSEFSVVERA